MEERADTGKRGAWSLCIISQVELEVHPRLLKRAPKQEEKPDYSKKIPAIFHSEGNRSHFSADLRMRDKRIRLFGRFEMHRA